MTKTKVVVSTNNQPVEHDRLTQECAELDAHAEQDMADLGLKEDLAAWPN